MRTCSTVSNLPGRSGPLERFWQWFLAGLFTIDQHCLASYPFNRLDAGWRSSSRSATFIVCGSLRCQLYASLTHFFWSNFLSVLVLGPTYPMRTSFQRYANVFFARVIMENVPRELQPKYQQATRQHCSYIDYNLPFPHVLNLWCSTCVLGVQLELSNRSKPCECNTIYIVRWCYRL